MSDRLCAVFVCLALGLTCPRVQAADKVDVVYLKNGDRLTCEIKKLDQGLLAISTDPAGSISVHWGEIASLASPREFDVQTTAGAHYLGSLQASSADQIVVVLVGGGSATLALAEVIGLAPIGSSVWSRMDGSLDAGFSFTQANLETHLTVNGTAAYRSPRYQLTSSYSSQVTAREDADRLFRDSLSLAGYRWLDQRWYALAWSQLQQNDELALVLRVTAGGGMGREIVHTNHRLWSTFGGLAYTHEQFTDEPIAESLEAALGAELNFFTSGKEDFKFTNTVVSYYRLTRQGRVRVELQNSWRQEFLKDFYWSLNGFDSFDGDPPDDQKRNDFGVSFTLGWKF